MSRSKSGSNREGNDKNNSEGKSDDSPLLF